MLIHLPKRRAFIAAIGLAAVITLPLSVPALGGETIKVGFFSPQTGFAASDGTAALHGATLAVQFVNEKGGVIGKKIELVNYDDASKPDQAANVAQKMTQSDKVVVGVSGSYSFLTRPAAVIFQRAKVPLMTAYAVHPQITETGEYVFRTGVPSQVEGGAAAWTVSNVMKVKRVALITMDNDAGAALADGFKKTAKSFGIEVVTEEKYSLSDKDLRPLLNRIKGMDVGAIYANGFYAQAAMLANQRQELGIKIPVLGMEGFDSPKFFELSKPGAAEGVMITTALDRGSSNPVVQRFLRDYQKAYGVSADMVAASSFDAVVVLAEAINRAGSVNPDSIVKALHSIKRLEGVTTGPFLGFTEGGDVIKPVVVQKVIGGEWNSVAIIDDPAIMNLH
ncbi:MAG: ABC transporter substrate-binding protein [Arenicellales bacterium]|jgi:branched-chain amino acid transport system substrate-binding protein|nr:ABC transporter substrate-binding protein [Arenicellales bacterium]|tara:strand:- start:3474 stop:4652 length:1179 start_codon:yes stop_codon:yes gene_type:complete